MSRNGRRSHQRRSNFGDGKSAHQITDSQGIIINLFSLLQVKICGHESKKVTTKSLYRETYAYMELNKFSDNYYFIFKTTIIILFITNTIEKEHVWYDSHKFFVSLSPW